MKGRRRADAAPSGANISLPYPQTGQFDQKHEPDDDPSPDQCKPEHSTRTETAKPRIAGREYQGSDHGDERYDGSRRAHVSITMPSYATST